MRPARDLRNVDLADLQRQHKQPRWDAPVNSPSAWILGLAMVVIILTVFAALEIAEWIGGRWGG